MPLGGIHKQNLTYKKSNNDVRGGEYIAAPAPRLCYETKTNMRKKTMSTPNTFNISHLLLEILA